MLWYRQCSGMQKAPLSFFLGGGYRATSERVAQYSSYSNTKDKRAKDSINITYINYNW